MRLHWGVIIAGFLSLQNATAFEPTFLDDVPELEGTGPPDGDPDKPSKRASSVGATYSTDGSGYYSGDLSGQLGLDEVWLLKTGGNFSHSQTSGDYGAFEGGADANVTSSLSVGALFNYQKEPGTIYGKGFTFNADYVLSDLWQAAYDTTLSFSFVRLEYASSQPIKLIAAIAARRNLSAVQSNPSLTLSQDLPMDFTLSLSTSTYNYSFDPVRLSQLVALRQSPLPGVEGLITGFPKKSHSVDLQWSGLANSHPGFSLRTAYSQTLTAVDSDWIRSVTLGGTIALGKNRQWETTVEATHTLPSFWYSKVGVNYLW